jgi:uncharacterized membrane protein
MRQLLIIIAVLVVLTQVLTSWSAQAEQRQDGLYYLVLSGDQLVLDRICSYGNCGLGFNSRIDALNYWVGLESQAFNIQIVPIPPPSA